MNPSLLLLPTLPTTVRHLSVRTIKGEEWWQAHPISSHCDACGTSSVQSIPRGELTMAENVRVDFERWRIEFLGVVSLCRRCLQFVNSEDLLDGFVRGRLQKSDVYSPLYTAFQVLKDARLPPNPFALRVAEAMSRVAPGPNWARPEVLKPLLERHPVPESNGPWDQWRLVVEGKEYAITVGQIGTTQSGS